MHRRRPLSTIATVCVAIVTVFCGYASAAAVDPYNATVVQTSGDLHQELTALPSVEFGALGKPAGPVINVNAGVHYQTIQGFGAAMTDTSAWLIEDETTQTAQQALMSQLFGSGGIHLNYVRVPMGASDFTQNGVPYSYDDMPAGKTDPALARFSIAHDQAYILPALRQVLALNPATEVMATPWSAPAWMKTNDSLSNIGGLGTLKPSAYGPYARYFVKFLQAYAQAGVPVAAITPQNEPGSPTIYPGMNFPAATEMAWIAHDLEPALAKSGLHPKIYAGDLGWGPDSSPFVDTAVSTSAARDLTGISWHCYYGAPNVMTALRQAAPRLDEIVDECSPGGISPTPTSEIVISSLRDWASTVALWNLALDPTGGPAQPPNHGCPGCVGLATINQKTKAVSLTRAYFQLGQASEFIAPGAQRIASNNFVSYSYPGRGVSVVSPGLDDVALRNPDGSIVLVAYDNSAAPITFTMAWRARGLRYTLTPGSMATFVWNRA